MSTHQIPVAINDQNAAETTLALALLADGLSPAEPAPDRAYGLHQRLQKRVAHSADAHRSLRTLRKADQKWQTLTKECVPACSMTTASQARH